MNIDPVDVGPGSHDFAHRPVGQPHDARNNCALAFLEHAGGLRFGDDQMQFLGGNGIARFPVKPERLEDQRAGLVEQPHERCGDLR